MLIVPNDESGLQYSFSLVAVGIESHVGGQVETPVRGVVQAAVRHPGLEVSGVEFDLKYEYFCVQTGIVSVTVRYS